MAKSVNLRQERKVGILIWMPKSVVRSFREEAQDKGLSLSSYVRSLILQHLKEKG